jgi:hypothetical protein
MSSFRRYAKALTAFVSGFAVPFAGALTESSDAGVTVTQGEWLTAVVGGLVAGFLVGAVPNRPPVGEAADPGISEQGYGAIDALVVVILAVLLVWLIVTLF